jgi:SpoVK/Ycf46/Vps4 family AAA+-type ATPase
LLANFSAYGMYRRLTSKIFVPAIVGVSTVSAYSDFKNSYAVYAEENKNESLTKLDHILSRINTDEMLNVILTREKMNLLKQLAAASNSQKGTEIPQDVKYAALFQPKLLKSLLLDTEKYKNRDKKETIFERISEQYIGNLPLPLIPLISSLADYQTCKKNNMIIPNRILLHGAPGLGKSYLVEVLARELELPFFSFSSSVFVDKYIGETSNRIRAAFEKANNIAAQEQKPVIVFIDEIDALAGSSAHEEYRTTRATLLTELQNLKSNDNIIIFTATNYLGNLDLAFRNRFGGTLCHIKSLEKEGKIQLINKYFRDYGIVTDKDLANRLAEFLENPEKWVNDESKVKCPECSKENSWGDTYHIHNNYKLKDTHSYYLNLFSNREIQHIIQLSHTYKFTDCQQNKENCNKHLCSYIKTFLDHSGNKRYPREVPENKVPGYISFYKWCDEQANKKS